MKGSSDSEEEKTKGSVTLWDLLPGEVKLVCSAVLLALAIFVIASVDYGMRSFSSSFSDYRERIGAKHSKEGRRTTRSNDDGQPEEGRDAEPETNSGFICGLSSKHFRRPIWCKE